MSSIIISDQSWMYEYDLETKEMSSQLQTSSSPRQKKAQQIKSNVKTMVIVLFDFDWLVHQEYVPRGQSDNEELYKIFLQFPRNYFPKITVSFVHLFFSFF